MNTQRRMMRACNSMRQLTALLVVCLLLLSGYAKARAVTSTITEPLTPLAINATEVAGPGVAQYPAGSIYPPYSDIVHEFAFRNDNTGSVIVSRIQTSCGCTSAVIGGTSGSLPRELKPGSTITVRVTLSASTLDVGPFSKAVFLYIEGRDDPVGTCQVSGELVNYGVFNTPLLDFGTVRFGSRKPKLVSVKMKLGVKDALPSIRIISTGTPVVSQPFSKQTVAPTGQAVYRFWVWIAPKAPIGTIEGRLVIVGATRGLHLPYDVTHAALQFRGNITGHINVIPAAAAFGAVARGDGAVCRVLLHGVSPRDLDSVQATCSPLLVARVLPATHGSVTIEVRLAKNAPKGLLKGNVFIRNSGGERIGVPVTASIN